MSTDINFHREHSRLSPEQLALWQGLPLCWLDVQGAVRTRIATDRPVIALIDTGAAEADIAFGPRRTHLDLTAGAMGLFEPGESRVSAWRCDAARRIIVKIDTPWLVARGLVDEDWASLRLHQQLEFHDPALSGLLRLMVREVAEGCPNGPLVAESLSMGLAMRLRDGHRAHERPLRERGRLSSAQLRRIDELIDDRLGEPLPLAQLAEAAGCSAPHLSRLFRRSVGCSPHQYLLDKRVARARLLLQTTPLALAAVALTAGFSSQSHMNAVFARRLGTTPGAVRAQRRA